MSKLQETLVLLENVKVRKIVDAAKIEFNNYGIINSKLKDIAKRAGIGEATLYRTFKDKRELTQVVAFDYWYEKYQQYDGFIASQLDETNSGLDHILLFMEVFKIMYLEHTEFIKFLEDFDAYMMSIVKNGEFIRDVLPVHEELLLELKKQFLEFVAVAKEDGSIRKELCEVELYAFVSQTLMSTIQKLARRTGYLKADEDLEPVRLIENLIEMFKCFVSPKE